MQDAYEPLFALDLEKATLNQIQDTIKHYGVSGTTLEKAVRFFISAAQYAGVKLSPHVASKKGPGSTTGLKKKATKQKPREENGNSFHQQPSHFSPAGTSRSIQLRSGGVLAVTASVDLFAMSGEDRKFVFDLIDQIQAYEQSSEKKEV